MTVIKLQLKHAIPVGTRLDFSQFTVAKLTEKSLMEIAKIDIAVDSQFDQLGNWFSITGDFTSSDQSLRIEIEGDLSRVDNLGTKLHDCELRIEGSVGDHLGYAMTSGTIVVEGDAGRHCANQMRGGLVKIHGNASDYAGGARICDQRGMQGGRLIVCGSVGSHAGHRLRRGTIIIHADADCGLGMRMIAGTIAACGKVGTGIGCGMRRGTIVQFSASSNYLRPSNIPGFTTAEESELAFLPILLQNLRPDLPSSIQSQLPESPALLPRRGARCQGDRSIAGLGEIISL